MKNKKKIILGIMLLLFLCVFLYLLYAYRTYFLTYHALRVSLFGDETKKYNYSKEDYKFYSDKKDSWQFGKKWRFTPASRIIEADDMRRNCYYPEPIVNDVDKDGVPEVFITSYSRKVYCLNGQNGELIWEYELPYGITGGVTAQLIDVDNDGMDELVFGTHAPLPIRVYCIKTDKLCRDRLVWVKNVYGDFIEGALTSFINDEKKARIIYGTRSAPYIFGSTGVIDEKGRFLNFPTFSVDVCMAKPTVYKDKKNRYTSFGGSHRWIPENYGASGGRKIWEKYGKMIYARDVESGEILWTNYRGYDTGFDISLVVDYDFNGVFRIVSMCDNKNHGSDILDPETGELIGETPVRCLAVFQQGGKKYLLGTSGDINLALYEYKTYKGPYTKIYDIPVNISTVRYILDIDSDGKQEYLMEELNGKNLEIIFRDALSGEVKYKFTADLTKAWAANPSVMCYDQHVLADSDNDGAWEYLTMIGGAITCFDLPFKVKACYPKYNYMPFGDIYGTGYNLSLKDKD